VAENISFYVFATFGLTYLVDHLHVPRTTALNATLIGTAVEVAIIPIAAALSDRVGRRPVYFFGAVALAVWSFIFFRLLDTGQTPLIIAAMVGGLACHGIMYGPQAAFIAELFPTRMRYSGASLAYQGTSIFAGSLAPIIALALLGRFNSWVPIAIYLAIAGAISAFAALKARETKGLTFAEIDAQAW
jgi:MFS family permease